METVIEWREEPVTLLVALTLLPPAEVLRLLLSLEREVIVECLPTIWESELLQSVLVSCAQMRPLSLAGTST